MRIQRSADFWQATVERQRASGLSQKRFCEEQQIAIATFSYWSARFSKRQVAAERGFIQLELPPGGAAREDSGREPVVELPFGVVLRFKGFPS